MNSTNCLRSQLKVGKPSHGMRCIECGRPITDAPLSFAGCFACESCVVAYYQKDGPEVVEQELRERKFRAARLLQQQGKR